MDFQIKRNKDECYFIIVNPFVCEFLTQCYISFTFP